MEAAASPAGIEFSKIPNETEKYANDVSTVNEITEDQFTNELGNENLPETSTLPLKISEDYGAAGGAHMKVRTQQAHHGKSKDDKLSDGGS